MSNIKLRKMVKGILGEKGLKFTLSCWRVVYKFRQLKHHFVHFDLEPDWMMDTKDSDVTILNHSYGGICNLGDLVTLKLLNKFGIEPRLVRHYNIPKDCKNILLGAGTSIDEEHLGSLLKGRVKYINIWGSGIRSKEDYEFFRKVRKSKNVNICALRGYKSKKALKVSEDLPFGDPGFLLPRFFPLKVEKKNKVLYLPHYLNQNKIKEKLKILGADEYFDIKIPNNRFESALKEIISYKFVLTNSLHGVIICQAYNIPYAISLLPGEKLDARDKWDDLAGWLGIKDKLIFVKNYKEGLKWWKDVGSKVKVSEDSLDKLMDCFPYGGYL